MLAPHSPAPRLAVHRSRALIPALAFHRPADFSAARRMLDDMPDTLPMAGGLDVVNRMKEGLSPAGLVWLGGIPEAAALARHGDDLVAGALVRHDHMATSLVVRESFPDLASIWGRIANIRIRCQGTVIGNVLAQVPAYEAAVLLCAVEARLSGLKPGGAAFDLPVASLCDPEGAAVPCPGLVTAFRFPLARPGRTRRLVYDRTLRPALSVALCLDLEDGRIATARAVLGGTQARPLLRPLSAQGLALSDLPRAAAELAHAAFADLPIPTAPYNGRADYRARVAPVLLTRLITEAAR